MVESVQLMYSPRDSQKVVDSYRIKNNFFNATHYAARKGHGMTEIIVRTTCGENSPPPLSVLPFSFSPQGLVSCCSRPSRATPSSWAMSPTPSSRTCSRSGTTCRPGTYREVGEWRKKKGTYCNCTVYPVQVVSTGCPRTTTSASSAASRAPAAGRSRRPGCRKTCGPSSARSGGVYYMYSMPIKKPDYFRNQYFFLSMQKM